VSEKAGGREIADTNVEAAEHNQDICASVLNEPAAWLGYRESTACSGGDVELKTVQEALQSIPQVIDDPQTPAGNVTDLVDAAAEFAKLLRKLGVQQTREVREILSAFQEPSGQFEQLREAWQREQQRATESERQLGKLAEVFIAALDILDRMLTAFHQAGGMEDWERQTRQAVELCLHNAEKAGLVSLGSPGEPFDVAIHDLTRQVPPGHRGTVRVSTVVSRGYALNGNVLRRAQVDYVS
jgi:molecular chaperone GrpE (heat shock protein)